MQLLWNLDRKYAAIEICSLLKNFMILRGEGAKLPTGGPIVNIPPMKLYEIDLHFTADELAAYNNGVAHF